MTEDNPIKKGNPMINLVEDMSTIHEKTDLRLDELDDKVNKSITLVQQNKMAMLPHLKDLRLELWINYTQENITSINKFIKDLSLRLVKVSSYKSRLNQVMREFDKINDETNNFKLLTKSGYLPKIINLFNDSTNLWNDIVDNEEDLRREAWFNFLSKIFLPFAVVVSGGYWAIVELILKWTDLTKIIIYGGIILVVLYYLLLSWAKNPFRVDDSEE